MAGVRRNRLGKRLQRTNYLARLKAVSARAAITFESDRVPDAASKELSRNKVGAHQRITDNTLIHIVVDLLLAREADFVGNSKAELRRSVGL